MAVGAPGTPGADAPLRRRRLDTNEVYQHCAWQWARLALGRGCTAAQAPPGYGRAGDADREQHAAQRVHLLQVAPRRLTLPHTLATDMQDRQDCG